MRAAVAVLALALLAVPLPAVQAQAQPVPVAVLVMEDDPSDQQVLVAGTPAGAPQGRFAAGDLKSLNVEETADTFVIRLEVANLGNSAETVAETVVATVDFAHGMMTYRVVFWRQAGSTPQYGGQLQVYDAGQDDYGGGQRLAVTANPSSNTMEVAVPRNILLDEMGAAPFPGRFLTGFHAASRALGNNDNTLGCFFVVPCVETPQTAVVDAMPDQGVSDVTVPVVLGLAQSGYARLASDTPVRSSNGEATTFLFEVTAANLDANVHRFALSTRGVPGAWQVHLPSDLVEIDANTASLLPILVTTPFGHNHGTFQSFFVEMTSLDDSSSVGRVELGIRYVATPQPAGHHNLLYLHTAALQGNAQWEDLQGTLWGFDPQHLYFNTLEEDENDAKEPVGGTEMRGDFPPSGVPQGRYTWTVPLSPQLAMGLDFDATQVGTIRVLVDSVLPLPGAMLSGSIIHFLPDCEEDPDEEGPQCQNAPGGGGRDGPRGTRVTAALVEPSTPKEVAANSKGIAFETTIVATPAGDYLRFNPGATLTLQLNLTFARPEVPFGPHDMPKISGGMMMLPLLEYHDPVDQVFSSMAGLMIEVEGQQQRLANAGDTVVFDLQLMNHGDKGASYHLELSGKALEWANILGDQHVAVDAGEIRPLAIAVKVPGSAPEGEAADLVLTAVDAADPTQRTLARLVVVVDEGEDHPDDAARVKELDADLTERKSPAPGFVLGAAILALAALAVRRRRD